PCALPISITISPAAVIGTTFTQGSASMRQNGCTAPPSGGRTCMRCTRNTRQSCTCSVSTTVHGRGATRRKLAGRAARRSALLPWAAVSPPPPRLRTRRRERAAEHTFVVAVAIACGLAGAGGAIALRALVQGFSALFFGDPAPALGELIAPGGHGEPVLMGADATA